MEAPTADPPEHGPGQLPLQLLLAFLLAAAVAVGLCASAALRRRCGARGERTMEQSGGLPAGWSAAVKEALVGSLRWSSSRKLRESCSARWQGVTSASPVWQRRILMGERCELPRFSGLILYDDKGFPLPGNAARLSHCPSLQDKPAMAVTTLRDLL